MQNLVQQVGNGCFAIHSTPTLLINPWRVVRPSSTETVGTLLITHAHYAACSPADVDKLRCTQTRILGAASVAEWVECEILRPYQSVRVEGTSIKAIPMQQPDRVGFVVSAQRYDVCYLPDIAPRADLRLLPPDILILPLDSEDGAQSVNHAEEAAHTVANLRPRAVFPFFWHANTANRLAHARFAAELAQQTGAASIRLLQPDTAQV